MTAPVIDIDIAQHTQGQESIRRPQWSATPQGVNSNTAGSGNAMSPRRSLVESRRRIARYEERTFENVRWWSRVQRRFEMVVHSPGMVLVGGVSAVLFMGLSPLLMDAVPDEAPPAAVVIESSDVAGE